MFAPFDDICGKWGYSYRRNTKGVSRYLATLLEQSLTQCALQVYYDGHEREDVVAYRTQWTKRMVQYSRKMTTYEGDSMQNAVPSTLQAGERELVWVTHDECTFYSNDGVNVAWLENDETMLRKKSQGAAIMVSEFLCPCHGRLKLESTHPKYAELEHKEAQMVILPGAHRDGYWRSEDMVKQLKEKAIPIFEALHPNCQGNAALQIAIFFSCLSISTALFVFDQSSNHQAFKRNALIASRMSLNERPAEKDKADRFKMGWYWRTNSDGTSEQVWQVMYFMQRFGGPKGSREAIYFKGIKRVSDRLNFRVISFFIPIS